MSRELFFWIAFIALYFALNRWVLPRFGVQT